MSKKEKEKLVLRLLEEGKSTREVAKIAHVSPKLIGVVMRRATGDNNEELNEPIKEKLTIESKCYKMFKEGKSCIEVAIALNVPADEVLANHIKFQKLQDLDGFVKLYRELGDDLSLFVFLYKTMKIEGLMNKKEILNLVRIETELKGLTDKINKECQELGRLNLIKLQLRDQIRAMGASV